MFTVCIQHWFVPEAFTKGLLIPILKKPNIDPTLPKHYRPITISVTISKLFEHHILDTYFDHDFSTSQYGFIPERGSDKAAALAHDVAVYANASGSTVFYCSLDAEGAFDFLPHSVLLEKALGVVPDEHWRCIYNWYAEMCIHIKWCSLLGEEIPVERGTRQVALTSPILFNLFYEDLIKELNQSNYGLTIGGHNFNVICYADDILLCSLTSQGLQCLIDTAENYIKNHGLRFNPAKTECMLFGKCQFHNIPIWTLESQSLKVVPSIKYLGTILSSDDGCSHMESRKQASIKAFYSLQGAGVKYNGINPETAVNIYRTAVGSVMSYGCSSIHMSQTYLKKLDSIQSMHLKSIMGLRKCARTTPLLSGLAVFPIFVSILFGALKLLKSCLECNSNVSLFYKMLLKRKNRVVTEKTLLGRVWSFL